MWGGSSGPPRIRDSRSLSVADMEPGDINLVVNFRDVFTVTLAFIADPFPLGPADAHVNCP